MAVEAEVEDIKQIVGAGAAEEEAAAAEAAEMAIGFALTLGQS